MVPLRQAGEDLRIAMGAELVSDLGREVSNLGHQAGEW